MCPQLSLAKEDLLKRIGLAKKNQTSAMVHFFLPLTYIVLCCIIKLVSIDGVST